MTNHVDDPLFHEEPKGLLARILPPLVLICAFGGFVALAIYAYQAGTQSVGEGELMVIEADKTPMKEKPEDPGGMQFPNQDKTIFETFSGGQQAPKVERVLPTPEEPMPKDSDATSAPVAAAKPGAEQVFGDEDAAPKPTPQVLNIQEELGKQAVAEPSVAAPVVVQKAPVAEVREAAPEVETVVIQKPAAEKPVAKPAVKSGGKGTVQLGAYKTEAEAKGDFAKMQKKHAALAGKTPVVVRADLGDKGIFYRLRVGTDEPQKLCASLVGQACMVVK